MRFRAIVDVSAAVAGVSGRLEKIQRLADLLRRLEPAEIEPAVAFLSGATRQGRIGVGYAAIRSASDVAPATESTLSILEVDDAFGTLATATGKGSAAARTFQLRTLFSRATAEEHDFLRRLLFGELRQGALEGALVEAVARAADIPAARVRRSTMLAGDLGAVARAALTTGDAALEDFVATVMRPVQPMLAESADQIDDAVQQVGEAAIEYKLDGARIQVHKLGDDVRIFSRTLRDVTAAAPEVVSIVRALPARELILDGEVIALTQSGRPHPFQITMRRFGRSREIEDGMKALPLTPFFFDCLYVDGGPLVDESHEQRSKVLGDIAAPVMIPRIVRPTREEAETFGRGAADRGHEGVMVKALDAPYAAGRRGASWLKVKRAKSLDLVVLAAEWGHGRRRGWLSNLHLGARDPEHNNFVMLGKTFKGMTDEMLAWQTQYLLGLEIGRDEYTVYVRPELVVEIAYNDVQESPVYPGGAALRFARVKRYRTDKSAKDADTIATVRAQMIR